MALPELVVETLPKSEPAHGEDYTSMARAILNARVAMDAGKEAAAAGKSAAQAAFVTAVGTGLLFLATVALVVVEVIRGH
ncbi:MAG: hypothetical protein Q8Q52_00215 [Acidimicrobiia bacterium]|nr:hypothetical protein [Acidimicrobiia bacterium]